MENDDRTTQVKKGSRPWASGPREILQHGINLLQKDTDTNRRLAMLSIDNAVELMVKTYLGLPKRATGGSASGYGLLKTGSQRRKN
jgi:hypothetical protein